MTQRELFHGRQVGHRTVWEPAQGVPVVGKIEFAPKTSDHIVEPDEMVGDSQAAAILAHLRGGGSLTPQDALRMFGCFRLGARIWDLQRQGWPIKAEMITTESGKRVARYSLEEKCAGQQK